MIEYKSVKGKVEYCLNKYEVCRNSDKKLFNAILVEFYHSKLFDVTNENGTTSKAIRITDSYDMPASSVIERVRRKFNEEGKYLPTDSEVIRQRKINEKEWHNLMSPSNPSRG